MEGDRQALGDVMRLMLSLYVLTGLVGVGVLTLLRSTGLFSPGS